MLAIEMARARSENAVPHRRPLDCMGRVSLLSLPCSAMRWPCAVFCGALSRWRLNPGLRTAGMHARRMIGPAAPAAMGGMPRAALTQVQRQHAPGFAAAWAQSHITSADFEKAPGQRQFLKNTGPPGQGIASGAARFLADRRGLQRGAGFLHNADSIYGWGACGAHAAADRCHTQQTQKNYDAARLLRGVERQPRRR